MDLSKLGPYIAGGIAALIAALALRARAGASNRTVLDVTAGGGHEPREWTAEDYRALYALANRLGINPADLLVVLTSESNLRPDANNADIAKGLNQIIRKSAEAACLTLDQWDQFQTWSVAEQLPHVECFLRTSIPDRFRPIPSAQVLYAFNFAPGRVMARGFGSNVVLYDTADGLSYTENIQLDTERKGSITIGDMGNHLRSVIKQARFLGALGAMRRATGDSGLSPLIS
jgi:hypothetical protein